MALVLDTGAVGVIPKAFRTGGKAKSLLRASTLSVQEISDRLGFQNQSHFGTFFRRAVGVSPKAFRTGGK